MKIRIDLSNNILLETLDIVNTQIQSIDLSLLSSLKIFLCYGSRLQSLDISSNLQLTQCAVSSCSSMTSITIGENYDLSSGLSFLLCPNVSTVTVRGVSQYIADRIAYLIQRNSANAGTVYTNSADPYYSTIKTAADTYGWTVMPLAGSPYNPTATATLISAFRTQMYPICDYGWQHPEIVQYVNLASNYSTEDSNIWYSIFPILDNFRWLKGGGSAYILTNFAPHHFSIIEMRFCMWKINQDYGMPFGIQYNRLGAELNWMVYFYEHNGNSGASFFHEEPIDKTYSVGQFVNLHMDSRAIMIDNLEIANTPTQGENTDNVRMPLFAVNYNGNIGVRNNSGFVHCHMTNPNAEDLYLIPFKLGVARPANKVYPSNKGAQAVGTLGMLDLVTGLFYPNANSSGSFTEVIEPA